MVIPTLEDCIKYKMLYDCQFDAFSLFFSSTSAKKITFKPTRNDLEVILAIITGLFQPTKQLLT